MAGEPRTAELDAALAECTDGARVVRTRPVAGGCISRTECLVLSDGSRVFLKTAESHDPALLHAEAGALLALAATHTVRVPRVLAQQDDWLALEWLEPGAAAEQDWSDLGRALGALHRHTGEWGGVPDNFIGTLPQANATAPDWPAFWETRRLEPQLRRAAEHFTTADRRRWAGLRTALGELLAPGTLEGASLLHGDLWNGNVHPMAGGGIALVDPASYYGHREVDLAMADLFGGFAPAFRSAYEEAWPLLPGWPRRRAIYQLYYLLVHINLFGSSYLPRTREALRTAGF